MSGHSLVTLAGVALLVVACGLRNCPAAPAESNEKALMRSPSYMEVVRNLQDASVPIHQLAGDGRVAVTLAGGRVVAMAFSSDDTNLLWSHPQLSDAALVKRSPEKLFGGFGGDRLWFAPELVYNWDGVPNWNTFHNYKPPLAMDPGQYKFIKQDPRSVTLYAGSQLPAHGTDRLVGFEVERTIRITEPPLSRSHSLMRAVDYVGIESSHWLRLNDGTRTGTIGLWHLLQVPVNSVLVVPLKKTASVEHAKPLSYALPGGWVQKADHIVWHYGGTARAKFGLSADVLIGRSAVFWRHEPSRWCMIIRQFPVNPRAIYGDHPYGVPRNDQAFQAWDGYGFGEMEFHSSMLDAEHGPRELKESDQLWAFGGSPRAIAKLGEHLLGINVSYLLE